MDHARHLSSPSPTSPFLFHHSDRSFKSSSLMPMLSSTVVADVNNVDDCFSTTTSNQATTNSSHHSHAHQNNHNHHHHNPFITLDHHQHLVGHHHQRLQHHHHLNHHHHHHHHHTNPCVIDQDSLTGVDDVDGMHNILSGSSTSSSSTMPPLLTETHSHHSFSRISLEEYSPLSLVEDCDNALPISPTSLACGSHHPFKSSLNGLKMDNLVGDVHDHVGVNDDDDDVDVNDARSMSPSLMNSSTSNHHHHNLWSTSSTAITQSTSLLNNTSTSFLLSHHHHHHQLNSLIQQLEPQSLDESPPLVSNSSSFGDLTNSTNLDHHRPSSEPPPDIGGCEIGGSGSIDLQDAECLMKSQRLSKVQVGASPKKEVANTATSSSLPPSRTRKSRSRASGANNNKQQQQQQQIIPASIKASDQNKAKNALSTTTDTCSPLADETIHSSRTHLRLNHHKKLQELQQRLFGATTDQSAAASLDNISQHEACHNKVIDTTTASLSNPNEVVVNEETLKGFKENGEEPDSSASSKDDLLVPEPTNSSVPMIKTKILPARAKRNRNLSNRNESNCNSTSNTSSQQCLVGGANKTKLNQTTTSTVTAETAEPDTTTKSSDYIKLADLRLASSNNADTKVKANLMINGFASNLVEANDADNGDSTRRLQQIQLQVSPTLTVVANGSGVPLVQPISVGSGNQTSVVTSNGSSSFATTTTATANQILCTTRPHTVVATTGAQLKSIITSNNELQKLVANDANALLANWSAPQAPPTTAANSANGNAQTLGTHQIAIQVICQDGTSLVLPVSSAAGLNAAVSLSTQQLQTLLSNNANQQQQQHQQQRNNSQLIPLVSVSNIVAQQAGNNSLEHSSGTTSSSSSQTSSNQPVTGLAASSPTLAALLDAGVSRNNSNNNDLVTGKLSNQNFVSTNLLRKLVAEDSLELKKNIDLQKATGTCLSLNTNVGPFVTVCSPVSTNTTNSQQKTTTKGSVMNATSKTSTCAKRIKLEPEASTIPNLQTTTFTLIDPHGLIVGNSSTEKAIKVSTSNSNGNQIAQQQSITVQHHQQPPPPPPPPPPPARSASSESAAKQNKLASNTGNRQVDPTQPFRCEHCNSTFTRLGNFTRHKKIHTIPTKDGQRFKCDVCSKSFLQRCDLARHLHIHRGTEPHRCNICGKGYIRHSDLVTHQRFHNKEKPFGCPHCSKGFCQRGDLNRHLRSIHLQMKPILCPCCNRKFAKQETLLRHLNTAHRSKAGATTGGGSSSIVADPQPPPTTTTTTNSTNYNTTQGDDKQTATTISVVTNTTLLDSNNDSANQHSNSQKSVPVASLQAIQATLCKVPQSLDPSKTSVTTKVDTPALAEQQQETVDAECAGAS